MTPARRLGRAALSCQPDSRLVALVREGSDRAFEEIVGRYRRRLVAYAAGIVGADRAEDVVQESLVRALAAIRGGDAEISVRPWLYTIVRNRALNDRRDEPAHVRLDGSYDGVPQPSEIASRREELASVVDHLKALPESQREALVQRELEGRSHEEIAAALTVTPGAVRGLIFRARSALRDAAGLLVPMPVLRALAESSAVGDGGALVAAAGGGGALVKLGTALTVAAVAVGGGVALHDQGGKSDQAKADATPPARSAAGRNATHGRGGDAGKEVPIAAAAAGEDRGGGPGRDDGPDSSGPGRSGSDSGHSGSGGSGSGSSGSGTSGSGGPGSSGSTSDGGSTSSSGSGSGSSGSGSSGSDVSGSGNDGSGSGSGSGSSGSGSGDSLSGSSGSGTSGSGSGTSGSGSGTSGSGSSGDGSSTTTTTSTTTTMTTDGGSSGSDGSSGSSGSGSSGSGSSGTGS